MKLILNEHKNKIIYNLYFIRFIKIYKLKRLFFSIMILRKYSFFIIKKRANCIKLLLNFFILNANLFSL